MIQKLIDIETKSISYSLPNSKHHNVTFYFSSWGAYGRFSSQVVPYIEKQQEIFFNRYKYSIDFSLTWALALYKKIETVAFLVNIDGTDYFAARDVVLLDKVG